MRSRMDVVYEVCAFVVIVFGLLAGACFSMNHRDVALWLTCFAIVAAVIGGFSYWQDRLWDRDATESALKASFLTPGRSATPSIAFEGISVPVSDVKLFFGNSIAWTSSLPFVAIKQAGEDMLVISGTKDAVTISAKIFDKSGTILCELDENEIFVNEGNVFRIKHTPHRLTVMDHEARAVLDVEFINQTAIRVLGDYYLRNGLKVRLTPASTEIGPFSFPAAIGDCRVGFSL